MSRIRPPGWYPDATDYRQHRWWDGNQWTAQVSTFAPVDAASAFRAPEGTSPYTLQIWLIVAIYVVVAIIQFPLSVFSPALWSLSDLFRPESARISVSGVFGFAAAITLAYSDRKTLISRGVARPFHWAFILIPWYGVTVYVIGRSVVARRLTGRGLAPIWVHLASQTAGLGVLVYSILLLFAVWFPQPGSYFY